MRVHERRWLSFDATPLFYREVLPEQSPVAAVLVLHGMGEHGGRYMDFCSHLTGAGMSAIVPDLRGFGRSGGRRGHVRSIDDLDKDLDALVKHAQNSSKAPLFLMGHSFGGLLAARLAVRLSKNPPRGVVLSSPLLQTALSVPPWRRAMARVMSVLCPVYSEPLPIRPADLTHDTDVLGRDAADKAIHYRLTARLYCEMTRAMKDLDESASRILCPLLLLQAGEDRIVSAEASRRFFDRVASKDKTWESFPGFYHEILNETDRERPIEAMLSWCIRHIQ